MNDNNNDAEPNTNHWIQRLWRRPSAKWLLGIPLGGFLMLLVGAAGLGTFNGVMEASNSLEFCLSCHEMREFVFEEYKQTVHYQNASGVRAVCSDCHVPHTWFAKIMRKTQASFNELPHKVLGTINTREKFEAKRLELAEHVWAGMKSNDSRECRSCHSLESMQLAEQTRSAQKKHDIKRQQERGETCIDCHKGIAHNLPQGYTGD